MSRKHEKLTLSWFLRHPLVATCILLALTIVLPFLRVGERLKLLAFLPLAHASTEVDRTPYEELSEFERLQVDLKHERERASELTAENARLREAQRQYEEIAEFNARFAANPLPKAVPAQVWLHGDASEWRHSCWINRGREHGIEENMPVVAGLTLIGRVYMAGARHSCVMLITDPGMAVSCLIVDPDDAEATPSDGVRGVLRGDGSKLPHFPRLELDDVAVGAEVRQGMHVVTSDYSGQFPLGLHVGVVRETIPQAGFLQVRIEAGLDLSTLETVQVLKHKRPALEDHVLKIRRE